MKWNRTDCEWWSKSHNNIEHEMSINKNLTYKVTSIISPSCWYRQINDNFLFLRIVNLGREEKEEKARERGRQALSIHSEFTLSARLLQRRAGNSENVVPGPRERSEVGRQSARKRGGCATESRARGLSGLGALATPTLAFSVSTFRRARTREFGIVALIKPARVTSHEWWRHSPWFLTIHHV